MDLYNLLVFTDIPQTAIRATFRAKPTAQSVYDLLTTAKANHVRGSDATTTVSFSDDYSRQITLDIAHVALVQLVHVNAELNGEADLQQIQAHANAAFQKRMQGDPMLQQGQLLRAPAGVLGIPPNGRN